MTDPEKMYKRPVFSHPTRINCENCNSVHIRPNGYKFNGYVKYWKCKDCTHTEKTIGTKLN